MTGSSVRVSILLPAWNAAPTIRASLASVARQTFRAWECVVVDDGSDDRTAEIVLEFARRDPRVRLLSTMHRGLVAALNAGLERCTAPLIARMDADDLMHRDRLSMQVALLDSRADLAGAGCHVRIFPRQAMSQRLREYEAWLNSLRTESALERDVFVECPLAHPTLMMRREVAALGYRDRGWPEDYDLVLRALAAGMRLGMVPRRLHAWRDDAGGLARTDARYAIERFTACKAYFLATGFLAGANEYVLWGYGGTGRRLCAALAALGKRPSHIVEVKPGRIGQRIHGAPVIRPGDLPAVRGGRIIASVARTGPRNEIRAAMAAMEFAEGVDFVCAA